jgi:hypothetical protein
VKGEQTEKVKKKKKKKIQKTRGKESRRKCAARDGLTSSKEGNKCYFNLTGRVIQPHTKSQKVTLFSQRTKQTVERCFASTLYEEMAAARVAN